MYRVSGITSVAYWVLRVRSYVLGVLCIGCQVLSLSCIRYCALGIRYCAFGITSLGHRPYALDATSRATAHL